MNLSEQQLLPCHILKVCPVKVINVWQALTKRLPSNMFNSCRKAMILCLSNKSNPIGERIQSMLSLPPNENTTSCVAKL